MKFLRGFTKQEISWMMYDWANSAHSVVVVTILPIFFNTVAGYMQDAASGMTVWGYATSAAMAEAVSLPPRISARHCASLPSNHGPASRPTLYASPESVIRVSGSHSKRKYAAMLSG